MYYPNVRYAQNMNSPLSIQMLVTLMKQHHLTMSDRAKTTEANMNKNIYTRHR